MRILGIDLETSGLDHQKDIITEIAWVVKEAGDPKPLEVQTHFVTPPEDFLGLSPEIESLTKIRMDHLKIGKPLEDIFRWLCDSVIAHEVEVIVAHNGEMFDKPFLQAKTTRFDAKHYEEVFSFTQWLDSSVDLVYPPDCRYTNLMYVAAYFGFVNPFPHSALFDVMTMLRVVDQFPLAPALERANSPWCIVEAQVGFENKDLAKARRYNWENIGPKKYPKSWVKRIKEMDLEKERAEAPFQINRVE